MLTFPPLDNTPYTVDTSPVPTSSAGALGSASATLEYKKFGRLCHIRCDVGITTVGTASGDIIVPLPFVNTGLRAVGSGRNSGTALMLCCHVAPGSSNLRIQRYDAAAACSADAQTLSVSILIVTP
jgi:hypothetical protein